MSEINDFDSFQRYLHKIEASVSWWGTRSLEHAEKDEDFTSLSNRLKKLSEGFPTPERGESCRPKKLANAIRALDQKALSQAGWVAWTAAKIRDAVGGLLFGSYETVLKGIDQSFAGQTANPSIEDRLVKGARRAEAQQIYESNKPCKPGASSQSVAGSYVLEQESLNRYDYGACVIKNVKKPKNGKERENEDRWVAQELQVELKGQKQDADLFAVFDGHRGSDAAEHAKNHVARVLQQQVKQASGNYETEDAVIWHALRETGRELSRTYEGEAGSTAVIGFVINGKLWLANLGDSRAMRLRGTEALQLTQDQRPKAPNFERRVKMLGGEVEGSGTGARVSKLAMARALGDHKLKGIDHTPKITRFDIQDGDLICFASDGLWDKASTYQVGSALAAKRSPKQHAEFLAKQARAAGSKDDISVLVVKPRSR